MSPATATMTLLYFLHLATVLGSSLNYTILNCSSPSFFSTKDPYSENLDTLLSSLSTKIATSPSGFANSSSGTTNDTTVYGTALCRGDVDADVCTGCVSYAVGVLRGNCSLRKEAVVWREWCTVRYANRTILSSMEVEPEVTLHNVYTSSGDSWPQVRSLLLLSLLRSNNISTQLICFRVR